MKKHFGDGVIAITVVACSVVLFAALALALSRKTFATPARKVTVNFQDVTGISVGSQVKYGGAPAGTVVGVKMLQPDERTSTGDPANSVCVELALYRNVPALTGDTHASVSADTLLSDKFILLSPGSPASPLLAEGATLQGVAPVTFDQILRNLSRVLDLINRAFPEGDNTHGVLGRLGGVLDEAGGFFTDARELLADARRLISEAQVILPGASTLIGEARSTVGDATKLVAEGRSLISENRDGIKNLVEKLDRTARSLDQLAQRADRIIVSTGGKLDSSLSDLQVIAENLKVTSAYAKILTRSLAQRPQQIIWGPGRKVVELPTQEQILDSRKPLPSR